MTVRKHLELRGCNPNNYPCHIDEESGVCTFLLYNYMGQLVGYQQYRPRAPKAIPGTPYTRGNKPELRYWTFLAKEDKVAKRAFFGIETLDDRPFFFMVEGIFDAVKVHNAGYPCIATLSNAPFHLEGFFMISGKRVYSISDNDKAGQHIHKFADANVKIPDGYKDVGEMPQDEVNLMLENFLKERFIE